MGDRKIIIELNIHISMIRAIIKKWKQHDLTKGSAGSYKKREQSYN